MTPRPLTSINFQSNGLERVPYSVTTNHLTSVINNYRRAIVRCGFDCSLLDDREILAFDDQVDSQGRPLMDNLPELKEFLNQL